MKKYNKPQIEALALETVDVIETSGAEAVAATFQENEKVVAQVKVIEEQIATMSTDWQW